MRELDGYCTDCESHTKIHNERCSCEGEEPVAWRYRGDFIGAKLPWQHTDQKWLADRQEEDGEEVEPLYPASAISRLVKERDEAKADHEWMTANRNKWQDAATVARNRVTELEASITRLTALLAEADEVVKEQRFAQFSSVFDFKETAERSARRYQQKREAK